MLNHVSALHVIVCLIGPIIVKVVGTLKVSHAVVDTRVISLKVTKYEVNK
jgi:hypothetical protein